MWLHLAVLRPADFVRQPLRGYCATGTTNWMSVVLLLLCFFTLPSPAVILWSDSGSTLVRENGGGTDILEGAVKRDDTSNDTLYFKFHLNPLSDVTTEEYFAAFELYDSDLERLGIGNALQAWAYSAFLGHDGVTEAAKDGYIDLHSSKPEPAAGNGASGYEFPRRDVERTIIFKIQYVPGGDDIVTVWLNPDLGPGANEVYQPESLTTRFNADASFDEIHLRHGGAGGGWIFSDMAIATSFNDFVDSSSAKPGGAIPGGGMGTGLLSFRSWQREQGMPRGPLRTLAQTPDGYLWIGSDEGLSRFDGVQFTPVAFTSGRPFGSVRALFTDSRGALWIGSASNGLVRYEKGRFSTMTRDRSPIGEPITAFAEDERQQLWVGSEAGVAICKDGHLDSLPGSNLALEGKTITALSKGTNGTMWAAVAGKGVFQFKDGKWIQLVDASMDALLQDPHCLLVDKQKRLWIGAGNDFLLCGDGEQWRRYRVPHHSLRSYVTTLAEELDGTIWAGSAGEGLFEVKAGQLAAVNAGDGIADNMIMALEVDNEGKLWVSTESGLNRLERKGVFVFSQSEGLGYGAVRGLAEVAPGVIWVMKPNDGLYRWEGGKFNRLTAAGLLPRDPAIGAMLIARDHSCWVACREGLLHFKDPQAVADESRLFALANVNIISLAEDAEGNIWAGTREGQMWKLTAGKWIRQFNFVQPKAITSILPCADGSIWTGTDGGGLYRQKDGRWSHLDKHSGLASDSIRALYSGSRNALWVGTMNGLSRWRDGKFVTFTSREGLPDDSIFQITEDDAGRLWLGTSRGIVCVSEHDFEELAAGRTTMLYPRIYGKTDGLLSEECVSGFFPAGLKTKSGLVWFSTLKGAVAVDPGHLPAVAPPPIASLEEVLVDGKSISGFDGLNSRADGDEGEGVSRLRIPPGRHNVEFQYGGPSFDAPEQTHFRYQLEGLDVGWFDAGPRRTAPYNYVPPGKYRFRVVAGNSEGEWNPVGAGIDLVVARHFWQAWWVITLGGMGILAAVGGGARFVEKRKLQRRLIRLEQERALERERTRIAQDLHDEMGAKLCRISFLSEHAKRGASKPGEIQNQIASISDAARDVLHSLDEIVWAVNPQNDTLEHVASYLGQYAQDYFQLTGIECEVDLPAQLPVHPVSSQVRHHLFLSVHEAFTNILKHSGATRSKLAISCNHSEFTIRVEDNGSGINGSLSKSAEDISVPGDGLANMRQRMADIGGDCRIESEVAHGTRVQFVFPLNRNKIKRI